MEDAVCLLALDPQRPIPTTSMNLAKTELAKAQGWNKHQIGAALHHADRAGYVEGEAIGHRRIVVWRLTQDGRTVARLLLARGRRITGEKGVRHV